MTDQWVDILISKLEDAVAGRSIITIDDDTGKKVVVSIKQELIDLLKDNRTKLVHVGRDAFKEFVDLWYKQKEFDALCAIYKHLDNSELIEAYREDTIKLAEIARETQETRDFWISFGKQVGMRLVLGALGAII
jgi:hypothetical protein